MSSQNKKNSTLSYFRGDSAVTRMGPNVRVQLKASIIVAVCESMASDLHPSLQRLRMASPDSQRTYERVNHDDACFVVPALESMSRTLLLFICY